MKKIVFALAAVIFAFASCDKAGNNTPVKDYSKVKVQLSLTRPAALTKVNYSLSNPSNPIGGFNVTWEEGDGLTLIVFQGDNASWSSNFVTKTFSMPAAAEGQTSYDVSSLTSTLDLSGFDSTKNLKYCVVQGSYFNDYWKLFDIYNGFPYISADASVQDQINGMQMMAVTDVKEVPFPSGVLTLKGDLHWITSVFVVQYDIDPAADVTYDASSYFVCELYDAVNFYQHYYVDNYLPVVNCSESYTNTHDCMLIFQTAGKLSSALDANNCRYYTIPADTILDAAGKARKIGGSSIRFRYDIGGETTYSDPAGSIADEAVIEAGKVYGVKIKVTDSNSDGKPEFTKI